MQKVVIFLKKLEQQLNEEEILQILVQILDGLDYLHHQNIIHRDLKLENILLTKNGQIKLADFGFSKEIDTSMVSKLTFCGTLPYISPEIYLNKFYGKPSDIWAVGVIGYFLSTQYLPFNARTQEEFNQIVVHAHPNSLGVNFSKTFNDLIINMLNTTKITTFYKTINSIY